MYQVLLNLTFSVGHSKFEKGTKYHVLSIPGMHVVIEMRIILSNISTSIMLAEYRTLYFVLGTLYKKGTQNYQ